MPTASTRTRFWANCKEDELSVSDNDARLDPSSSSRFSTSSYDNHQQAQHSRSSTTPPPALPRRRSSRVAAAATHARTTRQQAAGTSATTIEDNTKTSKRQSARPKLSAPKVSKSSATNIAATATTGPRGRWRKRSPSPSDNESKDSDDVDDNARGAPRSRSRARSRSRSRSLSVIPTVHSPPLTFPAPDDAAVRALGLTQSSHPGATALTLERDHIIRMREGHLARPRPPRVKDENRNWKDLTLSEAAWARLEEVGCVNKGRAWTTQEGYDENGEPVKPDLPYVMLTKLVIASSPRKMLTLNQIYQAMEERWPYFRKLGQTFRNSIRHNLSMNSAFVNVERPMSEGGLGTGKGGYWKVSDDITTSHRGRGKKPRLESPEAAPIRTPSGPAPSFDAKRYVSVPAYAHNSYAHGPAYHGHVETAPWAPPLHNVSYMASSASRQAYAVASTVHRDVSELQYTYDTTQRRNSATSQHMPDLYRRDSTASQHTWHGSYHEPSSASSHYSPSHSLPRALPSPYMHTPMSSPVELWDSRRGSLERTSLPSLRTNIPSPRFKGHTATTSFESELPTPPYEHCSGLMQLAQAAHPLAKAAVPRHSHDGYFPPQPTRLPGVSALLNPPLSPESQGSERAFCR